jgi:hypothetical protein
MRPQPLPASRSRLLNSRDARPVGHGDLDYGEHSRRDVRRNAGPNFEFSPGNRTRGKSDAPHRPLARSRLQRSRLLIVAETPAGAMTTRERSAIAVLGGRKEGDHSMIPRSARHELLLVFLWLIVGITFTAAAIWLGLEFHSLL